ncbi:MAG TPA: alpha/beta hydrolase [Sphingomonadaceae bacterium]|nr:alpha/beta hydrolase [Sphingomonadaceae bacterium]
MAAAPPPTRPDVRRFLDHLASVPGPRSHEAGPVEARRMAVAARHVADAPVGELAVIRDLSMPGPAGDMRLRLFDARASRSAGPALVYFHGGGFVLGDLDTHEPICAEIARALDMPVVSVDYRLAPEYPWPAAPEDCIAAARWIAGSPALLGLDVTGLVLAGDSAGGNLTIVASLALRDEPAAVPVLAQWPIYPAADPRNSYPSFADFSAGYFLTLEGMIWFDKCYAPQKDDWRYSPLVKDQVGMPPTLVVTAGLDPIRDQGRAYAAACVQAGVPTLFHEARGQIHGFVNFRKAIPSAKGDVARSLALLKTLIAQGDW